MSKKQTDQSGEGADRLKPAEKPVKIPNRTVEEALRDLMQVEPNDGASKRSNSD